MDAVKKLLCVLLSVMCLAGCGGQAAEPTPTLVPTPTSTPVATPTPEPTPEPVVECTIPPLAWIPDYQLVTGSPYFDMQIFFYGIRTIVYSEEMSKQLRASETNGKYFAVAAYMETPGLVAMMHLGITPGEWLASRGFRVVCDYGHYVEFIGTKEMISALSNLGPGMYLSLFTPDSRAMGPGFAMTQYKGWAEEPMLPDLMERMERALKESYIPSK